MFHTPNRLMLGAPIDHYDLAQTLNLNAFWPLDDASITTTTGIIDEIIGGSDSSEDHVTTSSRFVESEPKLMNSSVSSASVRFEWNNTSRAFMYLGDISTPADGNLSFELWTKWQNDTAIAGYFAGMFRLDTQSTINIYNSNTAAETIEIDNVNWNQPGNGGRTGYIVTFSTEGVDCTVPMHWVMTQSKSGSNYDIKLWINGTMIRHNIGTIKYWAKEGQTGQQIILTALHGAGGAELNTWYQSVGFYNRTLTSANISALYNAGKL